MAKFAAILAIALALIAFPVAAQDVINPQTNQSALTTNKGQLPGTTTNDNAAAGNVGQYISSNCPNNTATVTITIASPAVVTWTGHGFTTACPVTFTTSGTLPTGLTAGTSVWVIPSSVTANTFQVASSVANALAGTAINTSGTQSGTQTGTGGNNLTTGTPANITGISLPAGDWDVSGICQEAPNAATTSNQIICSISTTSAALNLTPGDSAGFAANLSALAAGSQDYLPTSIARMSLSATTTVFMVGQSGFATNTMAMYGSMRARRVR
jgi:hypothetical protein